MGTTEEIMDRMRLGILLHKRYTPLNHLTIYTLIVTMGLTFLRGLCWEGNECKL